MFREAADSVLSDRFPPQNLEAERGVIGSVLQEWAVMGDVAPVLEPGDFYRDSHETLWRELLAVYAGGGPCDALILADRLEARGLLRSVGGVEALAEIQNGVPHSANAVYYAGIVKQKATARGLLEAYREGEREILSNAHTAGELLELAERRVFALADTRAAGATVAAGDVEPDFLASVQRRRDGEFLGLTSGLSDLDDVTCGFQPENLIYIAGRTSMGKAQPLDALVLTPTGYVGMGGLSVGDEVIGSDGKPCKVIGVYPQGELPVFKVTMSDGGSTECCEEHLWFTQSFNERRRGCPGSVKSLKGIMRTLERLSGAPIHSIPVCAPVAFDVPFDPTLHPYALGLLLGDGGFTNTCVMFHNPEPDLCDRLAKLIAPDRLTCSDGSLSYRVVSESGLERARTKRSIDGFDLAGLGSKEKFIPLWYLYAPVEARLDLLRGLMDTDGYVTESGQSVEYTTSSPNLARQVRFLARSLGGVVSVATRVPAFTYRGETRQGAESHRMVLSFPNGLTPVSSAKHLAKWKGDKFRYHRTIVGIEPAGFKPCQCIKVDAPDQLYVTDDFIVTHNTALALKVIDHQAVDLSLPTLLVSLEMSRGEIFERMAVSRSRVDGMRVKAGTLSDGDFHRIQIASAEIGNAPLFIDDTPGRGMVQVVANARRHRARHGIGLLVVDLINHVRGENADQSRREQMCVISQRLKLLAREIKIPVIVLAQLNRGPDAREKEGHRPRKSDLKECGNLEEDGDLVILLHRPEYYKPDDCPNEAVVIVDKNRNGPQRDVRVTFNKSITRFDNFYPAAGPGY